MLDSLEKGRLMLNLLVIASKKESKHCYEALLGSDQYFECRVMEGMSLMCGGTTVENKQIFTVTKAGQIFLGELGLL